MKKIMKVLPVLFLLIVLALVPSTQSMASTKVIGRRFNVTFKSTVTTKVLGTKKSITINSGTKAVANGHGKTVTCTLSSGKQVKVSKNKLHYAGLKTTKKKYSQSVNENFVNSKGYSSKTKYLIWVNQYTCMTTIFKGSKGKWKQVRSMICVVGKGTSDAMTTSGVFKLCRKDTSYGMPRVYFTWNSSKNWGNSFHRRVSSASRGAGSHGCVRLGDSDLLYLVNTCPMGTTVVSY
jgi:hypothetical protein